MNLTAFIFARGGSKGLPRKNIKPLAGKPLIGWAIEQALSVDRISRVVVSTDDIEIADIARSYGAHIPFLRPTYLAEDAASEWDAWRHALEALQNCEGELPDPFISVPATSPLRLPSDIDACLDLYFKGEADMVVSMTQAHRNPWFNMVRKLDDGTVATVNDNTGTATRRQDAPAVFDLCTVAYVASASHVIHGNGVFSGRVRAVEVPVERSLDIDTPYDFDIAELIIQKRLRSLDEKT